jgi:alkyl hydroperoxide reductase subunit AhpF
MALLSEPLREQLRERFAQTLNGPVTIRLYVRPGTGRLILPSGVGCATCNEARAMVEELVEVGAPNLSSEVVDVTVTPSEVDDVPTFAISASGEAPRIRFQGLPGGFEFGAFVDGLERVSEADHALSDVSLEQLKRVTEPVELLIFSTPG